MKFWQKYKAKKEQQRKLNEAKREQERKLNEARFINFYGAFTLDLSLGDIKQIRRHSFTNEGDYYGSEYSILILYKNLVERRISFGYKKMNRDTYHDSLLDFYNSGEYRERLNYYNQLKYGEDVSKLELASNKPIGTNEGNIINLSDYR